MLTILLVEVFIKGKLGDELQMGTCRNFAAVEYQLVNLFIGYNPLFSQCIIFEVCTITNK